MSCGSGLRAVERAAADHEGDDEGGHARADVDDGAAGEVERAELEQPAVDRPDPVGQRRVDEDRPEDREEDEGAEALALGEGAGDEGRRDGREHQLERGEQDERDGDRVDGRRLHADTVEERVVEAADEAHAVDVRPEREGEADDDPDDADQRQPEEAVHDRRQDVLAAHEPAVEQGQARQHDHHQRRGHQHPGGIATIHLCSSRGSVQGHTGRWAERYGGCVPGSASQGSAIRSRFGITCGARAVVGCGSGPPERGGHRGRASAFAIAGQAEGP